MHGCARGQVRAQRAGRLMGRIVERGVAWVQRVARVRAHFCGEGGDCDVGRLDPFVWFPFPLDSGGSGVPFWLGLGLEFRVSPLVLQ